MNEYERERKWYKTWWGIILLIFIWPIALFVYLARLIWQQNLSKRVKIGLILLLLGIFFSPYFLTNNDRSVSQEFSCIGPDGKRISLSSAACKEFNEKWSNRSESSDVKNDLSHDQLLKIIKEDPKKVISTTKAMTLYLEQAPTDDQAEFLSQPDDNSADTILISCLMTTSDLEKLDGKEAQNRNYQPYSLNVTFIRYQNDFGPFFEAKCTLEDK